MGKTLKKQGAKPTKSDPTTRNAAVANGALPMSPADYLKVSERELQRCFKTMIEVKYRDSIPTTYGLNRMELECLIILSSRLENLRRPILSRDSFIRHVSGNNRVKAKFCGYLEGLLTKGCIGSFEYINRPDSLSFGITDYGYSILTTYFKDQTALFRRYFNAESDCPIIPIVIGEDIPKYHSRQTA